MLDGTVHLSKLFLKENFKRKKIDFQNKRKINFIKDLDFNQFANSPFFPSHLKDKTLLDYLKFLVSFGVKQGAILADNCAMHSRTLCIVL